jgi:hypothetical protein
VAATGVVGSRVAAAVPPDGPADGRIGELLVGLERTGVWPLPQAAEG